MNLRDRLLQALAVGRVPAVLLVAPALLYGALVRLRLAAWRRGWLRAHRAPAPVISVGNLVVGGSGKTPLVDWLLHLLRREGLPAAVLTRGYGRRGRSSLLRVRGDSAGPAGAAARPDPARVGDEPALLAALHPDVPVYVGADRVLSAQLAAVWDAPRVLVLDDGYQHLRLHRGLNLLLVDADRGLGNGRLLPRGPLREPLREARRADAVLVTRGDRAVAKVLAARLREKAGVTAPVFACPWRAAGLRRLDDGATLPPEALAGRDIGLVCALAQPEAFRRTVEGLGARVTALHAYPDHDPYDAERLQALDALLGDTLASAPDAPAAVRWLTTAKDAVKLAGRLVRPERLWVLEMALAPEPACDAFVVEFLRRSGLK